MLRSLLFCCGFGTDPDLENATWENTSPFVPKVHAGRVIKVYDGDTITIAAKIENGGPKSDVYRFSVRLLGIDTPEMKSHFEAEKMLAKRAKEALSEQILGEMVTLENVSMEKYGRILANVMFKGRNMNDWMLKEGYALKYDGGTKEIPEEWRK